MLACLIRIDSKTATGEALPLFVSSHDDSSVCHLDGQQWEPAIARLPVLRYDFFGGDFSGNITAPRSAFQVATDDLTDFNSRVFAGARVRIWTGTLGDGFGGYVLRFDGQCTAEPAVTEMVAAFNVSVDDRVLDEPLLDIYEGTGTTEGPDDLTGIVKPLALGNVEYAFGRLINATDLVYQVSDGAVEAVNNTYDRGKPLGTSTGDYASYAALVAASIPAGGWGSCKAEGLARFGALVDAPAFDVSGDNVSGYVRKPGEIIARVAEIAGAVTDSVNIAAFDAARPYNQQIDLFQQTTARQVIQSIADSVGGVAGVTWTGKLFVQALSVDPAPTETLAADGTSDLAVARVAALPVSQPFWRLATEAEPTYVVLSPGDVATGYNFRGAYSSTREYRLDDLVYADDGRAFVYINATPGSGNAPPTAPTTSNSYWSIEGVADNTQASQVTFSQPSPFLVQADSEGTTTTDLSSLQRTITTYLGGVAQTSGVTLGTIVESPDPAITSSVAVVSGVVEIDLSQADASGSLVIPVIFGGKTYNQTVQINRSQSAPTTGGASGSSSFTDYTWDENTVNSTSNVQVTDTGAIVQSDGSGELRYSASASYSGNVGAVASITAQYSTDGSSWTNFASETTGSAVQVTLEGVEPGYVVISAATKTGLTATTDYYVRLIARRSSGTGTISWSGAVFNVKQP